MKTMLLVLAFLLLTSCRSATLGGFGQGLSDGLSGRPSYRQIPYPSQVHCYDFGGGMIRCYGFP